MDNNGMSVWSGPATFKANCQLEIGSWPFDNQTCELGFGSYTYGIGRMDIKLFEDKSGEFTSKYIVNVLAGFQNICVFHVYEVLMLN